MLNVTSKFPKVLKDLLYICRTGIAELVVPKNFKELNIKENYRCSTVVKSLNYSVGYSASC